jgi:hypothetical protein
MASCVISRSAAKLALPKVCQRADGQLQKLRSTHVDLSIRLHLLQKMAMVSSARSVTTLTETLLAQVPEKQKKMAELKKNHGDHVYVEIESKCFSAKDAAAAEPISIDTHTMLPSFAEIQNIILY